MTIYPEQAGYAVTSDIGSRYFLIKIHYDNPQLRKSKTNTASKFLFPLSMDALLDLRDSSGVRFYLGDDLRPQDLGYLVLGTSSNPASLALPPDVLQFRVDSFCPPEATRV